MDAIAYWNQVNLLDFCPVLLSEGGKYFWHWNCIEEGPGMQLVQFHEYGLILDAVIAFDFDMLAISFKDT